MSNKVKTWSVLLLLVTVLGGFTYYFYHHFVVMEQYSALDLSFDPYKSNSTYDWDGLSVTVYGGFIKAKIGSGDDQGNLVPLVSDGRSMVGGYHPFCAAEIQGVVPELQNPRIAVYFPEPKLPL